MAHGGRSCHGPSSAFRKNLPQYGGEEEYAMAIQARPPVFSPGVACGILTALQWLLQLPLARYALTLTRRF